LKPTRPPNGEPPLHGRVALVTGGSRGLGRAIALAFAAAGADIVVTSRDRAACETVAAEVEQCGRRALVAACHIGRWDELPGLVERAWDWQGHIDVLVNNAGSSPLYDSLADVSQSLMDSVLNVNLKGPFRLAVLTAERMRELGRGSIINISSLAASRPEPRALPYAAAKAGLDIVTAGLAQAYATQVRVNSIRPGSFATTVSEHWPEEIKAEYAGRVVLGRIADPDEITGAALFLAGDASSFVTGTAISVDGGPR
jgi:NAD(P)-dependent dehydrogenase (short-subunit alcohol dehydrogenase family)